MAVEGCKHSAPRCEISFGVGKIWWHQFNDGLEFFAGGHPGSSLLILSVLSSMVKITPVKKHNAPASVPHKDKDISIASVSGWRMIVRL